MSIGDGPHPIGNSPSNGAVDEEEEPGPTQIPTSTTVLGLGEDIAYQEIMMDPPRGAVGRDATGGSPELGAVRRGGNVIQVVTRFWVIERSIGCQERRINSRPRRVTQPGHSGGL